MLKFGVKVGLAGSAVYYLKEEGIWRDSETALKTYDRISASLEPYVQEAKKQIPIQLPKIPDEALNRDAGKIYWNKGVTTSFVFLSELPRTTVGLGCKALRAIKENPEVRKVLEGAKEQPAATKK